MRILQETALKCYFYQINYRIRKDKERKREEAGVKRIKSDHFPE